MRLYHVLNSFSWKSIIEGVKNSVMQRHCGMDQICLMMYVKADWFGSYVLSRSSWTFFADVILWFIFLSSFHKNSVFKFLCWVLKEYLKWIATRKLLFYFQEVFLSMRSNLSSRSSSNMRFDFSPLFTKKS